jgi:hypothetical protein
VKVLITGDRNWSDEFPIDVVIAGLLHLSQGGNQILVLLHGDARGADTLADTWRDTHGIVVKPFPADWAKHGKAAGPIRNRRMLDEEPDLVVAFHDDLASSKGTKDCVEEARRRQIPTWVVAKVA